MNAFFRQIIRAAAVPLLALALAATGASAADWTVGQGVQLAKLTLDTPPSPPSPPELNKANPKVQAVMAVQARQSPGLMAREGVAGLGVGQTEDGEAALVVLAETPAAAAGLPNRIEGVPVVKLVTGKIMAMKRPAPAPKIDPTTRFARPVPIGVSTGNIGECSAGTIGARVKDASGNVYALSNNHVYALENHAPGGSDVLQPGRYDTACASDPADVIGQLADYEPIAFDGSDNVIDAAIAQSDTGKLGNATPSNGYGLPKSATANAALGDPVQKYGRTTSLTKGTIASINTTVNVGYTDGTARFVGQILVTARKAFIKAGDSGSLLVTDPGRNPVGLLFAGDASGRYAFANPIAPVLDRFGVTVDGE